MQGYGKTLYIFNSNNIFTAIYEMDLFLPYFPEKETETQRGCHLPGFIPEPICLHSLCFEPLRTL